MECPKWVEPPLLFAFSNNDFNCTPFTARTYSEPRKWMRGKGRVTLQLGCCYNYAVVKFPTLLGAFTFPFGFQNDFHVTLATLQDKNGNPPGIKRDEEVDPLPSLFKKIIKRMVRWDVLPPSCIPDSCIVNIYKEGDCIPPHIDHHDFVRPFCSLSLLTECNIVLGSTLQPVSPGEFSGPVSIPLPVGYLLCASLKFFCLFSQCFFSSDPVSLSLWISVSLASNILPFLHSADQCWF